MIKGKKITCITLILGMVLNINLGLGAPLLVQANEIITELPEVESNISINKDTTETQDNEINKVELETGEIVIKEVEDLESIKIVGKQSLILNEESQLGYSVTPLGADVGTLTWESDRPDVVYVDNSGKIKGLRVNSSANITVKSSKGKQASILIEVINKKEAVTGVMITNEFDYRRIEFGSSVKISHKVLPKTADNQEVKWSSSNEKIVRVIDGVVTGVGVGDATITVTTSEGQFKDWMTIIVTRPGGTKPGDNNGNGLLESIEVDDRLELLIEETMRLVYKLNPPNANGTKIYWESDNPRIAQVDDSGNVTGVSPGRTRIEVHNGRGIRSFYNVTVLDEYRYVYVRDLEIDRKGPVELVAGEELTLNIKVYPSSSNNAKFLWESSNNRVVTVDNGKIKAVGEGEATITVKAYGINVSDKITVKVKKFEKPAVGVILEKKEIDMFVGEKEQIKANINPKDSTDNKIKYITNSKNITVTPTGLIEAVDSGIAEVKVIVEGREIADTVKINVKYEEKFWGNREKVLNLNEKKDIVINLSMPVSKSSLVDNVYISKDATGNGEKLDVTLVLSNDGKSIKIRNKSNKETELDTELKEWDNDIYYVYIKPDLTSVNGSKLGIWLGYELEMRK